MKAKTVVFGGKGGHQHRVTRRLGQGGGPNRCKWARDRVGGVKTRRQRLIRRWLRCA